MDRDRRRRVAAGTGVGALLLLAGYVMLSFVAVVVFAVFLYYAVRPIFGFLARFGLGRRLRAVLALMMFGVPFLVLLAYTVAIIAIEVQSLLDDGLADRVADELNIGGFDLDALETLVTGEQSQVPVDALVDSVLGAAGAVGSAFVLLLLVVIITYYLLVDGPRLVSWLLATYDDTGIGRQYVDAVDTELSVALFGNIVNVFVTAIIGVTVFYTYNAFVPSAVAIPYPALLAALAGIGSLIPVIGIKFVYIPLTAGLAVNAWRVDAPELLVPVAVLFVVSAVVVDFVPDVVARAQVSSDETHTGLLIVAYIVGPSVFGFYGLFLAPILLVATTNAVTILLPYVISGDPHDRQTTLERFTGDATGPDDRPRDSPDDD